MGRELPFSAMARSIFVLAWGACLLSLAVSKLGHRRKVSTKQFDDLVSAHPEHVEAAGHCMTHGMALCLQICGMTTSKCNEAKKTCIQKACNGDKKCEDDVSEVQDGLGVFADLSIKATQKQA